MISRFFSVLVLTTALVFASCAGYYGNMVGNQIQQLNTLNSLMAQVNNQSSAEALAPQLTTYGAGLGKAVQDITSKSGGDFGLLDMLSVRSQLKDDSTKQSALEFVNQSIRLYSNNFYGSETLKNSFWEQVNQARKASGY